MSSFFNQISQISTDSADETHNNPNATPTPVETAAAYRLLMDQFATLRESTGPNSEANQALLEQLILETAGHIAEPPGKVEGVPQSYLDSLERVPKKELKMTDTCPICGEPFLNDLYPLVVELPCHKTHRFDLDCVGPWLRLNGTCPLDRKDLTKKKEVLKPQVPAEDDDEEEDYDRLYG